MTDRLRRTGILATLTLVAAACAGGSVESAPATPGTSAQRTPGPSTPDPSAAPTTLPSAAASAAASAPPTTPVIGSAWAQAELTDVATGETFRIADLAGKAVILETMAIWCPNCLAQQADVQSALEELDPERVAYVVLDVDPNETADALAEYRARNGFTGTYAIAGRDVARGLSEEFGDQVLNPPSTPVILIGTDGRVTLTEFGHKSPAEIVALARDHGA